MLDNITTEDLQRLAGTAAPHVVSFYLPTHRAGPDQSQDPIRLKNLATTAAKELEQLGLPEGQISEFLAPVTALLGDATFWAHGEAGLAIFVSQDSLDTYRLPIEVEELVVTADRFHVKPLIPAAAGDRTYYLLALSQHSIRLLRGNRTHVSEIQIDEIPHSLESALRFDDRERQLQSHGAARVGRGRVQAAFHGHGVVKDTSKSDLLRFLRVVDDGINGIINDPATPLVLAGVEYVVALYRQVSRHPRIVERALEGNPDRLSNEDLHAKAWPIVEPVVFGDRALAVDRFHAAATRTLSILDEVLPAAVSGRIDTLFVPEGLRRWGTFEVDHLVVDRHGERQPGDRDLFDTAAIETLVHGGTVYVVPPSDVPGIGPLGAILRY